MSLDPGAPYLDIAPEVHDALAENRPVVALESTIICHGMPYPQNVETALRVEDRVRANGAVPATIAVLEGRIKAGLSINEINCLGGKGQQVLKCSRRDLPLAVARGLDAATTVAATMIVAAMTGIRTFATGGIGGVHRGAGDTMDISADLDELGRSDVAVICAGVKSVLDIGRTLEYLETRGVPVIGYGTHELPAFYTRGSGYRVDYRVDSPEDVAAAMRAKWEMGLDGGIVVANPIPEEHALEPTDIDMIIDEALVTLRERGITGRDTTPFLLARIAERTGGRSLDANIELVLNNASLAAHIAGAHAEGMS